MKRIFAIFLCLILVTPILVFAQTVKERIDLDFVDGLRKRGDIDLALDYLKIIEKMASPELKINIPLEIARTQLAKAIAEPDTVILNTLPAETDAEIAPSYPTSAQVTADAEVIVPFT